MNMLKPIKDYLNLIDIVIRKDFNYYHDKNELYSNGQLGLMKAYDTFDNNKNFTSFVSFAMVIIRRRIIDYLRIHGGFNFVKKRNGKIYNLCEYDDNMVAVKDNIDAKIDMENMLMNTKLTYKQRYSIIEHDLKGVTFNELGKRHRVRGETFHMHRKRAFEKIRKQFNITEVK